MNWWVVIAILAAAATVADTGLFDERTRARLLESRLPNLELRLEGRKLSVHMDGIASSREELEELIEIASLGVRAHLLA
jgi:hypothetical protein